jgi:hypothetical protein
VWDEIVISKPNLTLGEFLAEFTAMHHGCVIDVLEPITGSHDGLVLYNEMDGFVASKKEEVKKRMATPVAELWAQVVGPIVPKDRAFLLFDASVSDAEGNPAIVPIIRYNFVR